MKRNLILSLLVLLPFFECTAQTRTFQGKVIRIADGDTFTVLLDDKTQVKIRVFGIDAPESGQAFGQKSRQWLADRIFGKVVTLEEDSLDKYGRSLSKVFLEGTDVGLESIKAGMAWHYEHFYKSREYAAAMKQARHTGLGLWADKNPIEPYLWRKENKK